MTAATITYKDGRTETVSTPLSAEYFLTLANDIMGGKVASIERVTVEPPVTNAYGLGPGLTEAMQANADAPAEREWYHESGLGPKWALAASVKRWLYVYDFNTGKVTVVN